MRTFHVFTMLLDFFRQLKNCPHTKTHGFRFIIDRNYPAVVQCLNCSVRDNGQIREAELLHENGTHVSSWWFNYAREDESVKTKGKAHLIPSILYFPDSNENGGICLLRPPYRSSHSTTKKQLFCFFPIFCGHILLLFFSFVFVVYFLTLKSSSSKSRLGQGFQLQLVAGRSWRIGEFGKAANQNAR